MSALRRRFGLFAATALIPLSAVPVTAVAAPPPTSVDCNYKPGVKITAVPWPDTRLGFRRVWPITRGAGVRVAVIDSGINTVNPQLSAAQGIRYEDPYNVLDHTTKTYDCVNHGTKVAGIIAAQPIEGSPYAGVAPDATIIAIKMTNQAQGENGIVNLSAAIRRAADDHAQVANLSVSVLGDNSDHVLRKAVVYARDKGMILVCAPGNEGTSSNAATYPSAWSGTYENIIAVSAVDQQDVVTDFSETGSYVDLAAPGAQMPLVNYGGDFIGDDGTSFAAPFVTGTVALVLATHSSLTPVQVRARLEATADPPPATVPDAQYGFGIVDPYLAVTAVRPAVAPTPTPTAAPLPALPPVRPADHRLQHIAQGVAAGLLALALLAIAGSAVLKASRDPRRRLFSR